MKINRKLSQEKLNSHLGRIAETIIKQDILANAKSIVKSAYPEQSDNTSIQFFEIISDGIHGRDMGHMICGKNSLGLHCSKIYGWHGDLGIILNDKEHGKRALIIEIKYGNSKLTKPQTDFFLKVSTHPPGYFMKGLNGLNILIFQCTTIDFKTGDFEYIIFKYVAGRKVRLDKFIGCDK